MRLALAALLAVCSAPAWGFPEGAPWEVARAEGCVTCHFDSRPAENDPALTLEGLPPRLEAGATYALTLSLADPAMARAGFLISAWQGEAGAGRFRSADGRTESTGAMARSSLAGSEPAPAGQAKWRLTWIAPARLAAPVEFEIWANAANGDDSPFEDRTYRTRLTRR